jgi:hypothetical protein
MPSQISICNQALVKLGANTITSIDQGTTEANMCKAFYTDVLNSVLEEYPWTFATKRYELPQKAGTPPQPYSAWYLIPSNVIRIVEASSNPNFNRANSTQWEIEGENILTNDDSLFIRAIIETPDPSMYTAGFVRAFVVRLAAEMSTAITHSRQMADQLMRDYSIQVQRAISSDGQQGRTRKYRSNQLIDVRNAGTSFAGPTV